MVKFILWTKLLACFLDPQLANLNLKNNQSLLLLMNLQCIMSIMTKVISEHTIDDILCSRTQSRNPKLKNQSSSYSTFKKKSKSNIKGKNLWVKVCYRYGDASHKVSECTFEKNFVVLTILWLTIISGSKREALLNCLLDDCYDIFSWVTLCNWGKEHIWYLDNRWLRHMTRFKSLFGRLCKERWSYCFIWR